MLFSGSVLRALERMGVPVLNSSESLALTRDRFHTAMALIGLALPVPPMSGPQPLGLSLIHI